MGAQNHAGDIRLDRDAAILKIDRESGLPCMRQQRSDRQEPAGLCAPA